MSQSDANYDPHSIEPKWQEHWLRHKTFKTEGPSTKPKYYILDMFPYPSGEGLHVGHPEGYTATDIVARYKRMRGFNVLHPIGWDAFGLPAEQHAVKTGTHPRTTTTKNIDRFRAQIRAIGLSYDWDREINTTDESYYRWTQWIFLKLYEKGLAYESSAPVNWCEELGTVLANEEVIDGKSEVGGFPVTKRPMRQWVLQITAYADRLLNDLDGLDWPEAIKEQQRNWIGKSTGATVSFAVAGHADSIKVFTTRPDTLFGATFMVLAPEHPLVLTITTSKQRAAIDAYIAKTASRSERDRLSSTQKTGENTGAFAINPVNQAKIPIFIADYVLASYGSGAIMAVPAHDERDHAFALQFDLPIMRVLDGGNPDIQAEAFCGAGTLVNSGFLNGLSKVEATEKMLSWLEDKSLGTATVTYKLRDWLFSRQRYWGEPLPLMHDDQGKAWPVPLQDLPVRLPVMEDYRPTGNGEPPLTKAPKDWLEVDYDGRKYRRETNVMPQWGGSCWYYLRFIDPHNAAAPWDKKLEQHFMPVDLYVGGAEHAVLHLLYARFWHKVLYDLGYVSTNEPFQRLVNQGMILGEDNQKMSKSRGNVVNPDDVIREWGADSLRLYEMFMGPLEAPKPWQTNGITGCNRFLRRTWRLLISEEGSLSPQTQGSMTPGFSKLLHKAIKKIGEDIEGMRFNTAVSTMMELTNQAYKESAIGAEASRTLVLLLAPFAPHIAEELWQRLGQSESLAYASWPSYEPGLVADEDVTLSIQINGKLRGTLNISISATEAEVMQAARTHEAIARQLAGKTIKKEIYVPGKIVSFVVA